MYWEHNIGTITPPMLWDAYKAYTRGQYQRVIRKVREDTGLVLKEAEQKAQALEFSYVQNKDAATYDAKQSL